MYHRKLHRSVNQFLTSRETLPKLSEEEFLELCFTPDTAKFAHQGEGLTAEPLVSQPGEHLCSRIYTATGKKQVVVERDDALLKPEETNTHWAEVRSAIKVELQVAASRNYR